MCMCVCVCACVCTQPSALSGQPTSRIISNEQLAEQSAVSSSLLLLFLGEWSPAGSCVQTERCASFVHLVIQSLSQSCSHSIYRWLNFLMVTKWNLWNTPCPKLKRKPSLCKQKTFDFIMFDCSTSRWPVNAHIHYYYSHMLILLVSLNCLSVHIYYDPLILS